MRTNTAVILFEIKNKAIIIINIFIISTLSKIRLFKTLPMNPGALSILYAKSPRSELIVN